MKLVDGATGQLDVSVDGKQIFSIQAPGAKFDVDAILNAVDAGR